MGRGEGLYDMIYAVMRRRASPHKVADTSKSGTEISQVQGGLYSSQSMGESLIRSAELHIHKRSVKSGKVDLLLEKCLQDHRRTPSTFGIEGNLCSARLRKARTQALGLTTLHRCVPCCRDNYNTHRSRPDTFSSLPGASPRYRTKSPNESVAPLSPSISAISSTNHVSHPNYLFRH